MVDFLKIFRKSHILFLSFSLLILFGCKEDSREKKGNLYPHFSALKASKINARCGPGMSYPIEWTFIKSDIPVEVLEEYDHWRKIRDFDGSEAWVNKTMLKKKRTALIKSKVAPLYKDPHPTSLILAHLVHGVLVDIQTCDGTWCRVKVQDFKGFVIENDLFGTLPHEKI